MEWTSSPMVGHLYSEGAGVYGGTSNLFTGNYIQPGVSSAGEWLAVEFPYKATLRHMKLTPPTDPTKFPASANVYATNDSLTWTEVAHWSGVDPGSASNVQTIIVNATESFKKYAMVATKTNGSDTDVALAEWDLFTESFSIEGGKMTATTFSVGGAGRGGEATTKTFVVTVSDASGANKYYIDGVQQSSLQLEQNHTYIFDVSSTTLSGHPLIFSTTATGGEYTTGITNLGAYGGGGTATRTFVVSADSPTTLYYFCTAHPGMGATISISPTAEFEVSGRIMSRDLVVTGGTTAQRPTYAPPGTIRYNSTIGFMEAYTVSGWGALAPPPSIVSISPTSLLVADTATQVFTVSGGSFDSGLAINLVGADGTNYEVVDRTFVNAATTTFKMGDLSSATAQVANRPYTVKITGGSGIATISFQTIMFSGISWTSPAAGATLTFLTDTSVSHTLVGTDSVGGTSGRTFAVAPGSNPLPTPLSLNPNSGVISGTIGAANSGTNVTFRVVDVSGVFVERTFNIVGGVTLYDFISPFTFTPAKTVYGSGSNRHQNAVGPTLSQMQSTYSPSWTNNTNYLNSFGQGVQLWTVPETATYQIHAYGASGGATPSFRGGYGWQIRGDFQLIRGEIIRIVVGQVGASGPHTQASSGYSCSGGGGTFVVRTPYNTTASVLVVAGGGGGASENSWTNIAGLHAQASSSGVNGGASNFAGGSSGSGGYGTYAGGGAGFSGDGQNAGVPVAKSFTNGNSETTAYTSGLNHCVGGGGEDDWGSYPTYLAWGGFGGGGGGGGLASGGGGGYSGGGAGNWTSNQQGGGGGSYNNGSNQYSARKANPGIPPMSIIDTHSVNGMVIITKL